MNLQMKCEKRDNEPINFWNVISIKKLLFFEKLKNLRRKEFMKNEV